MSSASSYRKRVNECLICCIDPSSSTGVATSAEHSVEVEIRLAAEWEGSQKVSAQTLDYQQPRKQIPFVCVSLLLVLTLTREGSMCLR